MSGIDKVRSGGQEREAQHGAVPPGTLCNTLSAGSRVTLAIQRAKRDATLNRSKNQKAVDQSSAK